MSRATPIICLIVTVIAATAVQAQSQSSFSQWLGPQTNKNATLFAPVVGKTIDRVKHDKLPRYEISLQIVRGADLKLPASKNAVVTFSENKFQQVKEFQRDDDALYLLGAMQLKKHELGWRFYTLNIRATDGNLKGAVVHLRDGKIQDSITDPCIAVYRIPEGVKVETGKVPFEVVALFAK